MLDSKTHRENYGLSASKAPSAEGAFNFILPTQSLPLEVGARHQSLPLEVGALRKHAGGMFLATDRSGYAARREVR